MWGVVAIAGCVCSCDDVEREMRCSFNSVLLYLVEIVQMSVQANLADRCGKLKSRTGISSASGLRKAAKSRAQIGQRGRTRRSMGWLSSVSRDTTGSDSCPRGQKMRDRARTQMRVRRWQRSPSAESPDWRGLDRSEVVSQQSVKLC